MRKVSVFLVILLAAGVFSCKQYTANIEEFLSYWSAEASVVKADIQAELPVPTDKDGYPSVSSDKYVEIILKVKNPKNYQFLLPTASDRRSAFGFQSGVKSSSGAAAPDPGTDYKVSRIDDNTLKLVYTKKFLQAHEHGAYNLNPQIVLWSKEGRSFNESFTFNIRANTPPPTLEYRAIGKTQGTDGKQYYVLCLEVKDMENPLGTGLLHNDIAALSITAAGANNTVPLTVNGSGGGFDISKSNGILLPAESVSKLAAGETDSGTPDEIPAGSWIIYVKTGAEVKGGTQEYTFKLIDKKGLSSAERKVNTATNKLPPVRLYHNNTEIRTEAQSAAYPIHIGSSGGAVSLEARAKAGAQISGTVERKSGNGWSSVDTVSGTTAAAVSLPALGSNEHQAVYKIILKTSGAGYAGSDDTIFYVTLTQDILVSFSVAGGQGSLKGVYGATERAASTGSPAALRVPYGGTVTFTAVPADANRYKVGAWTCTPSTGFTGQSGQSAASLTVTANTVVSIGFVPLNTLTVKTLTIHGENAASSDSINLPDTVTEVKKEHIRLEFNEYPNVPFTIEPAHGLTLAEGVPQNLTINVAASQGNYPAWTKTVSITRSNNNKVNLQSFKLNGELKTVDSVAGTFENEYITASATAQITDCICVGGSTGARAEVQPAGPVMIPVNTGKNFTITVTGDDGSIQQQVSFTVKRATYTVEYRVTGNGGKLKADTGNFETGGNLQVAHGENVHFTALPDPGWMVENWSNNVAANPPNSTTAKLSNVMSQKTVTVTFKRDVLTINGSDTNSWKRLKQEAERADGHNVIIIHGKITASGSDNSGEIVINRNLTIEGTDRATAILNANRAVDGKPHHRIFKVEAGKQLTLKNLTLTDGGNDIHTKLDGAAIYSEGELNIRNCTLKGNEAGKKTTGKGGAVYVKSGICTITNCEFTENSANMGGAVYVEDGTCTIGTENGEKTTIYFNEAVNGAGIYVASKQISGCVINEGTVIGGDDEIYCNPATSSGGGIFISKKAHCTINGGVIIKNNKAEDGAGIANYGGSLLINGTENKKVIISQCTADQGSIDSKKCGGGICIQPNGTMPDVRIIHALIEGNTAYKGGAVYMEDGTCAMAGSATVTPSTGNDENKPGKNDIYLKPGKTITIENSLTAQGGIAGRITPETYAITTQVLSGAAVHTEHNKFTVTPQTSPAQNWTIDSAGTLHLASSTGPVYTPVSFANLDAHLTAASGTEAHYIKVTDIDASQLTGSVSGASPLGQILKKHSGKTIALALPDSTNLRIGRNAFKGCTGLKRIDLSTCTHLTAIGVDAFQGCTGLAHIQFPVSLVTIGHDAFLGCTNLTGAVFPHTTGWSVYNNDNYTGHATAIPQSDLEDAAKAAEHLRKTYKSKEWKRN